MTPKDWMKIESLLAGVADKDTLDAVKALVEGMETNLKGSLTANVVKSIQRGVISLSGKSGSATINAVDTKKAVVLYTGSIGSSAQKGEISQYWDAKLELTNSTTVKADMAYFYQYPSYVPYQVIEFY